MTRQEHRISVIVSHPQRRKRWTARLREAGYEVCACFDDAGLVARAIGCGRHALVIADASTLSRPLPAAIRELRRGGAEPPLILLAPEDPSAGDIVLALEAGADDVVSDALEEVVVLARIRAILRRLSAPAGPATPQLTSPQGGLRLDTRTRRPYAKALSGKWQPLPPLTPSETQLLSQFLRAPGVVFSRRTLMDSLRDDVVGDSIPLPNLVDKHIQTLRRKLSRAGRAIQSVYGQGYIYMEEP